MRSLALNKILTEEDFAELRDEIYELSKLKATEISDNEHKMLFVDVENRHKLIERINTVNVEMYDLFQKINEIPADNIGGLRLRALIEYCYYLTTYLRRKFKTLGDRYDFDAHMFDYYFLYHIHDMIPFLNTQFKEKNKDIKKINKYYQYIVNSVKDRYPFSLENEDLYKLIAK